MPRARTTFNACSVRFSPFNPQRIAVATAQNFGIIGNGRQHVFDVSRQWVHDWNITTWQTATPPTTLRQNNPPADHARWRRCGGGCVRLTGRVVRLLLE
jgi:hypothetical protein